MSTTVVAAANLSDADKKQAAEQALMQKQTRHDALFRRRGGVSKFIQSAQNSLVFQPDFCWDDMLSVASLSISVAGSIFTASTAPLAGTVTILPPKGGFKYITTFDGDAGEMSLRIALVQISLQGNKAFALAGRNMTSIAAHSDQMIDRINRITQFMNDPRSARMLLEPDTQFLKQGVQRCAQYAKEMANEYQQWLGITCEVHAACCQISNDTAEKQRANEVHLAAQQAQVHGKQNAADVAKENLETLKTSLKHAEEQYQKAANAFSSEWTLVGVDVVSNLAATANSALNQAVPVLVSKFSCTAQAGEAVNLFKGDQGGVKNAPRVDHSKVKDATWANAPPPNASVLPEDYTDIAYNIIRSTFGHVENLASLLAGKGGNIDWDSISSMDTGKLQTGLGVTKILLQGDLKSLGANSIDRKPTQRLKKIINTCVAVIDAITEYTGSNLAGNPKPSDDSEEVKKWKAEITQAYIDATALFQTSQLIPGASTPIMQPPIAGTPSVPDGPGLRAQIIGAAIFKLNSTSAVVQTTQANFTACSKDYLNAVQDLGNIQVELSKLDTNKIQMDQIRALLIKCIELLVQLNNQLNKLVAFFDAIDTIVTSVVETQVHSFLEKLESDNSSAPLALGGYTITEFTSILLYNSMLNIRCYCTLFRDLVKTYMSVDSKYLRFGVTLLSKMSYEVRGGNTTELIAMQARLNEYTNEILPRIQEDISSRQKQITDSIAEDVEVIAEDVKALSPNPLSLQTQIEGVSKEAEATAFKGIQESGSYARAPMNISSE